MVEILSVTLIDLETRKETVLTRKKNWKGTDSRCFFNEWIEHKNYRIQLRLDTNDNPSVDPVLDADIIELATGKKIKNGTWHHTQKEYNSQTNSYIYTFKFEELQLLLNFAIAYHQKLSEKIGFVDSLTVRLVKGRPEEKK